MNVTIQLVEGISFYRSKKIPLPSRIDSIREPQIYCWSHFASVTIFLSILFLRVCGKTVYYIPDGIFEYANMQRPAAYFGRLCMFFSNGMLCGDAISEAATVFMGIKVVRCARWSVDGQSITKKSNPESIIVATARTPYFNLYERNRLIDAISGVIHVIESDCEISYVPLSRKIYLSTSQDLVIELDRRAETKFRNSTIDHYLVSEPNPWIVSSISTVLLKSLCAGMRTSMLPFRGYERNLGIPFFPECLSSRRVIFSSDNLNICVSYIGAGISGFFFGWDARVVSFFKQVSKAVSRKKGKL